MVRFEGPWLIFGGSVVLLGSIGTLGGSSPARTLRIIRGDEDSFKGHLGYFWLCLGLGLVFVSYKDWFKQINLEFSPHLPSKWTE